MTFDASLALRYATDFGGLPIPSIVGVSEYASYLVTIANDQVDINDTDTARVISVQRLLVADGYRSYAANDGYLNVMIEQAKGEQLTVSAGQLTANELLLGPMVFPYTFNNFSGGIDPQLFQPAIGSNNNVTVYVQIQGTGLSPTGNFFTVGEVIVDNMSNISYSVKLLSNNLTISLV